jgi:hypothetical protein
MLVKALAFCVFCELAEASLNSLAVQQGEQQTHAQLGRQKVDLMHLREVPAVCKLSQVGLDAVLWLWSNRLRGCCCCCGSGSNIACCTLSCCCCCCCLLHVFLGLSHQDLDTVVVAGKAIRSNACNVHNQNIKGFELVDEHGVGTFWYTQVQVLLSVQVKPMPVTC